MASTSLASCFNVGLVWFYLVSAVEITRGSAVSPSHFRLDPKSFSGVHAQSAGSAPVAVAFGPVFLAVARLAVDLVHMDGHCCAVQVLLTDHLNQTGKKGCLIVGHDQI